MTTRYPKAVKPNYLLSSVNMFALDVGQPALADDNAIVTSRNLKVGALTLTTTAGVSSADGLPRNVTIKRTAAGNSDTGGTIKITGTDAAGVVINETLNVGADGVEVVGAKAFKIVTEVLGAGWVIDQGNDTIIVGFGALVGFPVSLYSDPGAPTSVANLLQAYLGGVAVASPAFAYDAAHISGCTLDGSAGTYNGAKHLVVVLHR